MNFLSKEKRIGILYLCVFRNNIGEKKIVLKYYIFFLRILFRCGVFYGIDYSLLFWELNFINMKVNL